MDAAVFFAVNGHVPVTAGRARCEAVAARFSQIAAGFVKRKGEYLYDGYRTEPAQLGWRFEQMFGGVDPVHITRGEWDKQIEETWHEAASAEHWYTYEKQWD